MNYILFDKDYKLLDMGWTPVPTSTSNTKQLISIPTVNIRQKGYIFVYLSYENESNNYVSFDDFKVTHIKSNILQYNEYYPFGLQTSNSWTRENASNRYLYNGGNELNENSGWYETFFRGYDAALGRFMQVDPLASYFASHSPYHFAYNNPVLFNDPFGAEADSASYSGGSPTNHSIDSQRFGPGSGNHWSDGSKYSDWSANGGSETYREGVAAGMTDIGGILYNINSDGSRSEWKESNGTYGYYEVNAYWNGHEAVFHEYWVIAQQGGPDISNGPCPPGVDCAWVAHVAKNGLEIGGHVGTTAEYARFEMIAARTGQSALSNVGRTGNLRTIYWLGQGSKWLGRAGNAGAVLSVAIDANSVSNGTMSVSRFSYNTFGAGTSIAVGAIYGGPYGALVGGAFVGGQMAYDGLIWFGGQVSSAAAQFDNAWRNGWRPGMK